MANKVHVQAKINGSPIDFLCDPRQSLLEVLRDNLNLTGAKEGCNNGNCGACNVILNGVLVNSCLVLGVELQGGELTTIEGISLSGELHPLQQKFLEHARAAMWHLHPGLYRLVQGAARSESRPHGRRCTPLVGGQSLPLHRL